MENTTLQPKSRHVIVKSLQYVVVLPAVIKEEQERTRIKKKLFLEIFEKSRGSITATCDRTEISRGTFYNWRDNDLKFKKSAEEIIKIKPGILEDKMYHIALSGKGSFQALKYLLDRIDRKERGKDEEINFDFHELITLAEYDGRDDQDPEKQKIINRYKPLIEFLDNFRYKHRFPDKLKENKDNKDTEGSEGNDSPKKS